MSSSKPLASLSLDLDDMWSYLRTRNDPAWQSRPSYLRLFVPEVLDLLEQLQLNITFFIVGFDAAREANLSDLRSITARGHEVANHSFSHECWLHLYSSAQLEEEVVRAEEAILAATGQRPTGFRGPGFSWSPALIEILARRGYLYDATTLPTFLGPLARAYFLASALGLGPQERRERNALFGSFKDGFRPLKPYRWRLPDGRSLLEIPVTTMPVFRVPFHLSYLLYLARVSTTLMATYLQTALRACRLRRIEPSFLLHPLDILSGDQVPQLAFFPGMDLPRRRKTELFTRVLTTLGEQFEIVPIGRHASALLQNADTLRCQELALAV